MGEKSKNVTPEKKIAELRAELDKLAGERISLRSSIEDWKSRRPKILANPAMDAEVGRGDRNAERAEVRLAEVDADEARVTAELDFETAAIADAAWRKFFDEWVMKAQALIASLDATRRAQSEFLAHHGDGLSDYRRVLKFDSWPNFTLGSFPFELESIIAEEARRRGRFDAWRMRVEKGEAA